MSTKGLPAIERDEQMDRDYIPLPGGWELQTKGNGSTLRLCDTKAGERHPLLVGAEHVSEFVERMGREVHAAAEAAIAALKEELALMTMYRDRASSECQKAEAKLEAAEKDAARLDWLDRDGATKAFKLGATWYTRPAYGQPHRKASNVRAAIDAALAGSSGGKP